MGPDLQPILTDVERVVEGKGHHEPGGGEVGPYRSLFRAMFSSFYMNGIVPVNDQSGNDEQDEEALGGVVNEEGIEDFPHIIPDDPSGGVCKDIANESDSVMFVNGLLGEDDDKGDEDEVEEEFETMARPFVFTSHKYVSAEVLEWARASEHVPPAQMHFAVLCIAPFDLLVVRLGSTREVFVLSIDRTTSLRCFWSITSNLDMAIFRVMNNMQRRCGHRGRGH